MKRTEVNTDTRPCRPQPYRSLKEVELIEGVDPAFGAESHTAPPSPVNEKFSNINLLGDVFGCQDEPESQAITLAKSLEDLRTPKDAEERQAKFTYQVRGSLDALLVCLSLSLKPQCLGSKQQTHCVEDDF